MNMHRLTQWAAKSNNLLKVFLLVIMAASFSACEQQELPRSVCYPTEAERQAQKAADITKIKKYFRENNIDTSSMQTTESGIHYFNLQPSTGAQIEAGNLVQVHYLGKHLNGPTFNSSTTFDSSYDRAQPFEFIVGARSVIVGWDEALQLMKVGEETRFYIPSYLAYGPCGSGRIGPNEVLVFDINVLKKK